MASRDRKQKLYDLGREALGRLKGQQVLDYVCPICLRGFRGLDDLAEEHVPPESISGKVLCLTCRKCNCAAGHGVDAQVHREQLARSFLATDGQRRRAKIVVGDLQVNIDLKRTSNGTQIQVLGDQNDPKAAKALKSVLTKVTQLGSSFHVRDRVSYNRRTADIGYLKAAYLSAFAKLGYTYILRPALNRVRQQIQDPTCRAIETVRVYADGGLTLKRVFMLIHEPVSCLSVKINDSIVCLPLPDGDDLFYEKLAEMHASKCVFTWRSNGTIQWPERFELALDFAKEGYR